MLASALAPTVSARVNSTPAYKAIVFDAFPIFDPRPVSKLAETLFPSAGANLMNAWRTRQFEYQWLRALSDQYVDFLQATEDSLRFAAKLTGLPMTPEAHKALMSAYVDLAVWPDVTESLRLLRKSGIRLGILSNMTKNMLDAGLAHANLGELFEHVLSTDQIKTYKPAPSAYQMAMDTFTLPREQILFVPFASWDAAGAKWFGYPTFWVNRLDSPTEELGTAPDGTGKDLQALTAFFLSNTDRSKSINT